MLLKVTTVAGSEYLLDSTTMEWNRTNKYAKDVFGYPAGSGKLVQWPEVVISEPMKLPVEALDRPEGWTVIVTTPVVDFEVLE